jgi:hypothetical protein
MAKKEKLIPFRWLPASWGLVGGAYEEAKAYYELEGEDLERRLANLRLDGIEREKAILKLDLKYDRVDEYTYKTENAALENGGTIPPETKLAIELQFGKIGSYEHDCQLARIQYPDEDSLEHQMALLTADYEHGKIDEHEYNKTMATAKGEPWVGVIDNGFDPAEGVNGFAMELDWNVHMIEFLRKNGYHGLSDEQIIDQWFSHICQSQGEPDPEPNEPVPFNSGRVINRHAGKTGGTEFS